MIKVAVFVSGRGSNLRAILNSPKLRKLIKVQAVISNKATCSAFKIAEEYSISQYIVGNEKKSIPYNNLSKFLRSLEIDLVVLAGFLKMIPNDMILDFRNRIINIHPALLPSFGGKEMYGMNVHKAVYDSSAKVAGVTVHFVDGVYDTGKIITQRCVDISDVDSPEEISAKVLAIEHELLPYVIEKFALDKIIVGNVRVKVLS